MSGSGVVRGYPEYLPVDGGSPGYVCAGTLDKPAARLVCGSTTGMFLHSINSTTAEADADTFYRGSIDCIGSEVDIAECSFSLHAVSECPHGLVQQLICTSCKSYNIGNYFFKEILYSGTS